MASQSGGLMTIRTTPPKPINTAKLRAAVLSELNREVSAIEEELQKITATWDHGVVWEYKRHYAGDDVYVQVFTEDEIFGWLNDGTSARYAIMNEPFVPKTAPGEIVSQQGRVTMNKFGYYTAVRGKQAMYKRNIRGKAGIAKREWLEKIVELHQDIFDYNVEQAIEDNLE